MKRLLIIFLLIGITACASAPSEGAVQTAIAETAVAQPTATFTLPPTETPVPSATIDPFELTKQANQTQNAAHQATANANATNFALTPTKTPTWTPRPSATPTPAPTQAPIVLTGSGDQIVDVDLPDGFVGLVHIIGNAGGRFFAVSNLDANNDQIDLLVNTGDPYDGLRPLDFRDDERTVRFQVQAVGEWTIEILPLSSIKFVEVPGSISGKGDFVFALTGKDPDTAKIVGNAEGRYFAVLGYSGSVDLLVNTGDPYDGTVLLDGDTVIIEIQAVGEWTIEITSK